jgi:hypothetical protein
VSQRKPEGRVNPERRAKISRSYQLGRMRLHLRHDQQSADVVVIRLFRDLHNAEAQQNEREVWLHLIRYLSTLERPDTEEFDLLD